MVNHADALGQCIHHIPFLPSKRLEPVYVLLRHRSRRLDGIDHKREDQFTYLPLFEDQLVCILPVDHPLKARTYVRLEDFGSVNLVFHVERAGNRFYQAALKPLNIEPVKYMTVGHPQAIIEMVAAGFGVSIFPDWAIRSVLESGSITARPITPGGLPETWHAALLADSNPPGFQKEFISIVSKMNLAN
jgi:LysR family transcriptional regulator, regulator for metE and metH